MNVVFSEEAYQDVVKAGRETCRSISDVILIGVGLYKLAAQARRDNQVLLIANRDGKNMKEVKF